MSKYEPLWNYIKDNNKDSYKLRYEEIENILEFPIDHSFLTYKKELISYGYEVTKISMNDKTKLITNGIYKISRNPAFLGFDLMYIGIALLYSNPFTIIFSLFAITMLHLQILKEEKYLEKSFKNEYISYKNKTNRYLVIKR